MFVSALPLLACFVLLWTPPVAGESMWNLVYLAVVMGLYSLFYVLNQVPYSALLPEIALTDQHRVRVSAWSSSFLVLGVIALYWSVTSFVQAVIPFVVTEICLLSLDEALYFYLAAVLVSLACYPLFTWLAGRLGKWRVALVSLLAAASCAPSISENDERRTTTDGTALCNCSTGIA